MDLLKPDICIIGAGAGGTALAAAAASYGVSVVLVERGTFGGANLNAGGIPAGALIAAAGRAASLRDIEAFGMEPADPVVDFKSVHGHVRDVVAGLAPGDSAARLVALGVRVVTAEARFRDTRTVVAGDFEIRARRFVVATGSRPAIPQMPGLEEIGYLTSDSVFDLTRRPAHLLVVGGGATGVELAQAFRRLGSRVTLLEKGHVLSQEDPEMAGIVAEALRRDGVDLRENAEVVAAETREKGGVRLRLRTGDSGGLAEGTRILLAAGRLPNVEGLDLAKAHVAYGKDGIKVGPGMRTTNKRIHAIGDVTGGPRYTHVAAQQAAIALRSILFRRHARFDTASVVHVVHADPELARVGLTEAAARAAGHRPRILRWPYAENDRARTGRRPEGHVKLLVGSKERILGVSIVGASAPDLIGVWALALAGEMRLRDVAALPLPYPALGEIGKRAALSYFSPEARRTSVRLLVRMLRIFG